MSRTNGALAIFVKSPGHSPVKSRLAADRGAGYAHAWYLRAATAVSAVALVAQARFGVSVYWAVAEPAAIGDWLGLPAIAQGEGGLGERMARVHAQLVVGHGRGILLGADTPQLSAGMLGDALAWLDAPQPRLALGPADDGGFWLFGSNFAPPAEAWTSVRYSEAGTARALQASLAGHGEWCTLPTLTDADHGADLPAVLAALRTLPDPLSEQCALADWMSANPGALP